MKYPAILFLLFSLSLISFAQKPKTKSAKKDAQAASAAKPSVDEKTEFENAVAQTDAAERITALQKFIKNFPKSDEKKRAAELIVSALAEFADQRLRLNDTAGGVELFKLALKETPKPVSDKLFTDIILQIPTNLFFRGERGAAQDAARLIEEKIEGNAKQILGLATFYLGTENAAEAKRLAEKAIQLEPHLPSAYQTLGLANRLNFQLDEAAAAYAKALELDANSAVSKRSLAEMKRATGKADEAAALYREILDKDSTDAAAQTGMVLALFDGDKRAEAETEMQKSLALTPNNLFLLVGAAYWYAAHNEGAKAVELAEKATAVEPRYTWANIALARGFLQQNRPLEAERALLVARQYGNFPTLDYEIAAARLQAGFFREAAEELKKTFVVKDGAIETKLGGRVPVEAKNFVDLLALERRASIFEPNSADNSDNAEKLKSLLDFSQKLDAADANETAVSDTADEFVRGDDKMKLHRQLFVASQLLEKKKALPKVLELTKSAVGRVDSSLEVATPSAAVLADELYESRRLAISKGELLIVPNIPRQTLSAILRGRIEDITGWALFQEEKPNEATIRLKRAVSVLPEKSAWWRGSLWRLGAALDADGKSKEALDAYIKSYTNSEPDAVKRTVIESLYQKVYGNTDGLEQKIGAKPSPAGADLIRKTEPSETVAQTTEKSSSAVETAPTSEVKTPAASETPQPVAKETPQPVKETLPTVKEAPQMVAETKPSPEISINQNAEAPVKTDEKTEKTDEKTEPKETPTPEIPRVIITDTEPKTTEPVKKQTSETNGEKSLFEPVIINVPKVEPAKNSASEVKTTEESAIVNDEKKTPAGKHNSDRTRQRVVSENKAESEPLIAQKISPCKITLTQENISLPGGRSLGLLASLESDGNLEGIKATPSAPNEIEVALQTEPGISSTQAFFIVRSLSRKTGDYSIIFELPCGRKEIPVKVR